MDEAGLQLLSDTAYLQLEDDTGVKHEWSQGVAVAMAGTILPAISFAFRRSTSAMP